MSTHQGGNVQNEIAIEEHDTTLNAKRVSLVSNSTIYAVVNTGAVGVQQSMVTLFPGPNFIGLVSIAQPLNSLVTIYPRTDFIGLMTVTIGAGGAGDGAVLDGVDSAIKASVTSIADGRYLHVGIKSNSTVLVGNTPNVTPIGNVTLNPSPNYIGLVTAYPVGVQTLAPSPNYIGLATIDIGTNNDINIIGNVTLANPNTYVGLTTTTLGIGDRYIGLVTAYPVGVQTLAPSPNFIGLTTVWHGSNVTLNASAAYIGLATIIPTFISGYTSLSTVISALATIVVPPSGQKIFVRNLYVSSLGGSVISFWSVNGTATNSRVPPTSLATQSGIDPHWGTDGIQWGAANDGLTISANATVGVMIDIRFAV